MSSALGWSQTCAYSVSISLNQEKSEVINIDPAAREPLLTAAPNLSVTNPDCASLLSSPLGSVDCVGQTIRDITTSLRTVGDRLSYLHAQYALLLFRHSSFVCYPDAPLYFA